MAWTRVNDPVVVLDECPFCHSGDTFFMSSPTPPGLMIVHLPGKGVNCPARFEQVCDSVFQGAQWWNDRSKKEVVK